jgi:hypothetical protein
MIKEERKSLVKQRLSDLELEYITDIPYDANLEDWVYEGRSLLSLESSPVLESVNRIMKRIGGDHGNS